MNANTVKAQGIYSAISTLAAASVFGGLTAADLKAKVDAVNAADALVEAKKDAVVEAQNDRDDLISDLSYAVKKVVNGVKGDPAFGPDSALYEAMGYVPDSKRKSGLTRGSTPTTPATT